MGAPADVHCSSHLQEDIRDLRHALKGLVCNERKVVEILGKREQGHRDEIAEGYQRMYGESVRKRLKAATSGKLERCLVLWMMSPAERDAALLHEALREGASHSNRALVGMLSTRPSGHMFHIKQAFYELFHQTLEHHIDASNVLVMEPHNKSKWVFWKGSSEAKVKESPKRALAVTKLLLALARGSRPVSTSVDRHIALADAHQLNKARSGILGNEETLIRIFCTRSSPQLVATLNYYQQHYGHDFEQALSKKDAGEFLHALRAVVQCIRQPSKFHAEELAAVLSSGAGPDDEALIRTLTTRAEVDMQGIKMEFMNQQKRPLDEAIASATSGHFRQFLVAITALQDSPRASSQGPKAPPSHHSASPQVSNGSRHLSDHSENSATSYFSRSAGSSGQNSF